MDMIPLKPERRANRKSMRNGMVKTRLRRLMRRWVRTSSGKGKIPKRRLRVSARVMKT